MKNSGLGCGCSLDKDDNTNTDTNLGLIAPMPGIRNPNPRMLPNPNCTFGKTLGVLSPPTPYSPPATPVMKYVANPMTATLTTGRQQPLAPLSPAQVWMQFFREGLAFGVAWAASLEQGRTVPAQWHHDLERAAQRTAIPVSSTGVVASNRDAFVAGFDLGIRIMMERRIEITAPNGRRYSLDFLRTQGRVAANNLFGQARSAVLPAIAGPAGMAPTAPGIVTRSTYDQLVDISRQAQVTNLRARMSATRPPFGGSSFRASGTPDSVNNWILYVMGQPARVPTTLNQAEWQALQNWANSQRYFIGTVDPSGPYLQAILNTTWVPQSNAGRTYYSSVGSR